MFNGFLALSSERIGSILNMTQMEAKYPSWNHSVFANDNGEFHIECDGKQIPISWEQAHALGYTCPLKISQFVFRYPDWDGAIYYENNIPFFISAGLRFNLDPAQLAELKKNNVREVRVS